VVRTRLDSVISDKNLKVYTHHGKYDLHVLIRHGFSPRDITFDTMIAAYLLGESKIGLKDLSFTKLGVQMTEISELIGTGRQQATMDTVDVQLAYPYACGDVEATFSLVAPFRMQLEKRNQLSLLSDIELPLTSVLIEMERAGIEQATRQHPFRGARPAFRPQDQDRLLGRFRGPRGAARPAPDRAARPRTPYAVKTQVNVCRRPASGCQSGDLTRPHIVQPDDRGNRAVVVGEPELAEHPHPH
jgi:hypothetical protein